MHSWKRAVAIVMVAALSLLQPVGASAEPAPRAQREGTDRRGDAIDPRGDIVAWHVRHRNVVTFRVWTAQGAEPAVTPAWLNTNTALVWLLETDGVHRGFEYRLSLIQKRVPPYRPYFQAVVRNLRTNRATCGGTTLDEPVAPQWIAPNLLQIQALRRCFGNPRRIRVAVQHIWDPHPRGGRQGVDRAPNTGVSLPVAVG